MIVHKIESLRSRIARFERERIAFALQEALPIALSCIFMSCAIMYCINRWLAPYPHWELTGFAIGFCLSMPLLLAVMPKRPTEEDVWADQHLRRLHGMDDTVDD